MAILISLSDNSPARIAERTASLTKEQSLRAAMLYLIQSITTGITPFNEDGTPTVNRLSALALVERINKEYGLDLQEGIDSSISVGVDIAVMHGNAIFRTICEAIKDDFGYSGIVTPSMTGFDIGFDSLDFIELIMILEDKLKINLELSFSGDDAYTFQQVADMCRQKQIKTSI